MTAALLITRDDGLLDDVLRLAAASGTLLEVAHDSRSALREWAAASVVLVGADLVEQVAGQRPPRRPMVHVVGRAPLDDAVFRSALDVGAVDVVELPSGEDWVVELLTDLADGDPASGRAGTVVGVVAGSGGAGATTFACALALTAARRSRTVLVDLDPLGPGVDRVVGLDDGTGVRWPDLEGSRGRLSARSLRAALPAQDGLAVLTWGADLPVEPAAATVREVLSALQRGSDLVVLDLPRSWAEVTSEVVTRCDRVLLVAEPTVSGTVSAARTTRAVRALNDEVRLVARRGGALGGDELAATLGVPLLAEVGHVRRLAELVDLGLGPAHGQRSPLVRAARRVLADLRVDGSRAA
jgi:secretion/DNA translocation related CpaE-like protein